MRSIFTCATAKRLTIGLMTGLFLLSATTCDAQILHRKKKLNKSTSVDNNAQPDKILYGKALEDIKHGRHEVGRLNMQTLINTYPDSEYLAKAKLSIADSYFKEGGTANMSLAISGYKDFIVFFPFLPEATYAQMQVAMAHYRQMEKPDRDRTHARAAEDEFQTFLQKYPSDPLAPQAEQHLREVQEILAEGDFRIGYYYFVKGDKRASAGRLMAVTKRYPLYSKSDRALWMLGDIFEKSEHKELAAQYYAQIVKNYPLSGMVPDAKSKLTAIGAPVPQPDAKAVAWMQAEQNAPRKRPSLVKKPLGLINSRPTGELQTAARNGPPNLQPESETNSPGDIMTGGGQLRIGGSGTGIVATVTPGTSSTVETTGGAENTTAPADGSATSAAATSDAPKDSAPPADPPATSAASNGGDATNGAAANAAATAGSAGTDAKSDPAAAVSAPNGNAVKASDSLGGTQNGTDPNNKKESTSKKKKGLRKVLPW